MPCYEPPPSFEVQYKEWDSRLSHNSTTADMLCRTLRICKLTGVFILLPKDVKEWYIAHKKRDDIKEILSR